MAGNPNIDRHLLSWCRSEIPFISNQELFDKFHNSTCSKLGVDIFRCDSISTFDHVCLSVCLSVCNNHFINKTKTTFNLILASLHTVWTLFSHNCVTSFSPSFAHSFAQSLQLVCTQFAHRRYTVCKQFANSLHSTCTLIAVPIASIDHFDLV